jgi:uncharacterized membrane protein
MEILVVVLFVILLFVILSFRSSVTEKIQNLERENWKLREQLTKFIIDSKRTEKTAAPTPPSPEPSTTEFLENLLRKEQQASAAEPTTATEPAAEPSIPDPTPLWQTRAAQKPVEKIIAKETITALSPPVQPQPSFFERHPDLEKFIGENLVNKFGIAILVLAIGFFVKYAIDKDWIGPVGRVGIGILCGGILVAVAHRLRNNYKAFSSVLVGGGLAVFYFTIALAYHQFHLFDQTVAFIIMVVITAFAVVLSLLYNRQELAIIALIGGFATPFLVSNNSGNYKTLFTYLLVLNTGLLILAYNKAWRIMNILAFIFTIVLFGIWMLNIPYDAPMGMHKNGFFFATAFYLLFFFINIANNIKENKRFIAPDFGILLLNTGLYFAAGIYFINGMHADNFRGLFSASMGVFNLVASFILFRNRKVDSNILYLLIGLTLTFISLTAPIQLHGNYITLFWASETVLLYWLYQRSKIGIIKVSSLVIWAAMLCSLIIDWTQIYLFRNDPLPIIFNKGFLTTLYAAVACYLLFFLRKKETGKLPGDTYLYRIAGLILLYLSGVFEINHQFTHSYAGTGIALQYILLYSFAFMLLFTWLSQKFASLKIDWIVPTVLLCVCLGIYLLSIPASFSLLRQMLEQHKYGQHFIAHWTMALLAGVICLYVIKLARQHAQKATALTFPCWLLCAWTVAFLSAEVCLVVLNVYYTDAASWYSINDVFVKTGLPILWGLCSFAFMWLGMRHKFQPLRIISLTLFSITLIKLFVYDIRNIPAGGKIAAFFCLGVLLLVVSFMYQRLKRIIIEDEKKPLS